MNAAGWPVARAVHLANREKGDAEYITRSSAFGLEIFGSLTGGRERIQTLSSLPPVIVIS